MVLPGVRDSTLARFLRKQGFVGVGYYPTSHFVHLDVRSRSYFWMDRSGPGRPNRERAIMRRETAKMDRAARRRGEEAVEEIDFGETGTEEETDPEAGTEAGTDTDTGTNTGAVTATSVE